MSEEEVASSTNSGDQRREKSRIKMRNPNGKKTGIKRQSTGQLHWKSHKAMQVREHGAENEASRGWGAQVAPPHVGGGSWG